MFFYNRGSHWKIDINSSVENVILSAASLTQDEVERRLKRNPFEGKELKNLLFDPQLYFSTVHVEGCEKSFDYLSTYDLFNDEPAEFNSAEMNVRKYKQTIISERHHEKITIPYDKGRIYNRVSKSFSFQEKIGVTKLIMPLPIVTPDQENFDLQLRWIEQGMNALEHFKIPCLITLAINEAAIIYTDMKENELISNILDNLSAIEEIDGFYVVIEQNSIIDEIINENIIKFIFEVSYTLGHRLEKEVIINYINNLGLLSLALGATGFGGGYYSKEKFFSPALYTDGYGQRYPKFYSNNLILDLYSYRDLSKINELGLFYLLNSDVTQFSRNLYDFYVNKNNGNIPLDWVESQNNDSVAKEHRIELLHNKSETMDSLSLTDKIKVSLDWLRNADIHTIYLEHYLHNAPIEASNTKHIPIWKKTFEDFIKYKNIP